MALIIVKLKRYLRSHALQGAQAACLAAACGLLILASAAHSNPPDSFWKYKSPSFWKYNPPYSPPEAPPGKLECTEMFPFFDYCIELNVKDPRNGKYIPTKIVPPEQLSPHEADPVYKVFTGTDGQGNIVRVLYEKGYKSSITGHRRFIVKHKVSKKELYNNYTSYWPNKFTPQEHLIKTYQGASFVTDHTYFFKSGTKKEVEYGEYTSDGVDAVPTYEHTAQYYTDTDVVKSKVASYFQEGYKIHQLISKYSAADSKTARTVNYYKVINYKGNPNIAVLPYKEDVVTYSNGQPVKIVTTWLNTETGDPTPVQPTTTNCNTSPAKCKEWQYTVD